MTPPMTAMPKLMVEPVKVIRYCRLSPAGATKVIEASCTGLNSSAANTPVTSQPATVHRPITTPATILRGLWRKAASLKQIASNSIAAATATTARAGAAASPIAAPAISAKLWL